MTTQYTPILKLALPVQGELSGTWGDVVNDNITSMIEQAIAGRLVINTWSGNSHTLTTANGTTAEARAAMLTLTDSGSQLSAAGTVVCPALNKTYIVKNGAGQIITVKTASGSGIAIPNGKTMLVYCDGTNVLEGVDHVVTLSAGTLTITGLTTFASLKGADATTVTGILDEDNMASNSATKLVTQQSVKAYVDAQVDTADTLAEILAIGNTTGSNDIDVDGAQKVQFRDAAIYINSSADGQLDIVADTEIQIATATVDLNGNLDVSGTALVTGTLDVDGATQLDSTLTVGVNDTGHDVKFFGATSGSYMLWDESADDLILGGAAGLNVVGAATFTTEITANGGIALGDNDKATFGASDDLQIYHSGSHSFIEDVGGGSLFLKGGPQLKLMNDGENALLAQKDAGVTLYHNSVAKIVTTATGIDVTGTVTVSNGSYAAPAIAFASDTDTGIARGGTNTLGFVSGGALRFYTDPSSALATISAGTSNLTLGVNAGNSIVSGGNYNTVVGDEAGTAITTGDKNVFVGTLAGDATTTAGENVAIGYDSLGTNILGSASVAVGPSALRTQNYSSATNAFNTAVGHFAGYAVTTGVANTLIGGLAGDEITTGGQNVALGVHALGKNTTANNNVSIGFQSMYSNTTGGQNTAVGTLSLDANTTGDNNVAMGYNALTANTTADYNVAIGRQALGGNTTGTSNVAVGAFAGEALVDAHFNTAVGYQALSTDTESNYNTAIGYRALLSANNTSSTNSYNVAVGADAGALITTGTFNTLIGGRAGDALTTGTENTLIGHNSTASAVNAAYQTVLGSGVVCVGNSNFTFGNGTNDSNIAFGATSITAPSDLRLKEDVETSTAGLSFINDLRPVTYKWKKEKDIPEALDAYVEGSENRLINNTTNHGFIAQEVKVAIDAHSELKDGFDMWMEKDSDGQQRIAPSALVPILVKAMQEQQALIEALTARITTLEG